MQKLDVKTASHWLSEAWGEEIPQSWIRVHKKWLLIRSPRYIYDRYSIKSRRIGWEAEVDCVRAPMPLADHPGMVRSNDISAEPWTGIKYEDSPFIPRNKASTDEVMAAVESKYLEANPGEAYTDSQLCLIATSGDCAVGGMGLANEVLLFEQKHNALVKKYLEAQLAWHMECLFAPGSSHKSHMNKYHNYENAGYALRDAGIFHHKWHQRTSWELAFVHELEIQREPYVVMKDTREEM